MKGVLIKLRENRAIWGILLILLSMVVFTGMFYYGLSYTVREYARANMIYSPMEQPAEILWYFGTTTAGRVTYGGTMIVENLLPEFLFPIIVGVFFAGWFRRDHMNKTTNIQVIRQGRGAYYLGQSIRLSVLVFLIFLMAQFFQAVLGRLVLEVYDPITMKAPWQIDTVAAMLLSAIKISGYYALILFFTLGLYVLIPRIGAAIYAIPLILTLAPVFISPRQIPLRQAFIHNPTVIEYNHNYYWMMLLLLAGGLILHWTRLLLLRDEI